VVRALRAESRAATPQEQDLLSGWSGWGAVKTVFDDKPGQPASLIAGREQLRELLTGSEYAAARRNTINAHYTGTALARAMWDGLAAFGFRGGRVLEPGCGSGNFIGLAPLGTAMTGIELDPVTAQVAAALYPHAQIRNESFADTDLPEGSMDAAIGNVPFGKIHLGDLRYNPARAYPIHTHFILKAAALVRPGGLIALVTSRYTLDGTGEEAIEARRKLAGLGELAAAVRLPSGAHGRAAGTDVVTDVLVIRRFADGEQPRPSEPAWIHTIPADIGGTQIHINQYFTENPGMMLGEMTAPGARYTADLRVTAPAETDVPLLVSRALTGAAAGRAASTAPRPATPSPAAGRPPEGFQQARADGSFARIINGRYEPFTPPGGQAGQAELRDLLGLRDTAIALLDAELATTEDAGLVDDLRAELNARYDAYIAAYGPVGRYTQQIRFRNTPEGRALREQLLADGHAELTGGKLEITDPAVRARLVADGHAALTENGELRFGRRRADRQERQRLLDTGQARLAGASVTPTDAGRARILEHAADLQDAVTIIKQRPGQGGFRVDPFAVRVRALEIYDPETGTARKQDIMRHRVLEPRQAAEHADNPEEALAICLDRHARVRLDVIATLLGTASEQEARARLGTLVFDDPAEDRLVPAPEYLSGNVRVKLAQAAQAAATDPAYEANIEALTQVIPPDRGPGEIEARLGSVFITPDDVQLFLRETLGDASARVTLGRDGKWLVAGGDRRSKAATIIWGTKDRDAYELAEHLLNRRAPIEIKRTNTDGKTWTDEEATEAAREKQAELSDRFAGWAWEDLDRAAAICDRYNQTCNAIVLRSYDDVELSLPGVNRDITLKWWQKAAVARMIYEPTAGLFHDMGAGKTLELIIGVMEQKRLGLIRKPVLCIKNHLLEQFETEFMWAYPQARIMCADTSTLSGDGRRQFIAACAAQNPDAIIMTRGAFEAIPLTPAGHEAYLDYMKDIFTVHAAAVTSSVADEETMLAEFEQKLREYFDPEARRAKEEEQERKRVERGEPPSPEKKAGKYKIEQDPSMCWEHTGADYLGIDESQDYNNLWTPSDEPGMAIDFTHRAIDLEMKLHAMRARYGPRVAAFATGTPVTNKIPQFWVLQRYLRPERLREAGFAGFTPWAATYTEPEQRLEMKADAKFGLVTRMRLINLPELLLDLHYFGDFKDADDIGLPRPAIRGGKPQIMPVPSVPEHAEYQATLPARYAAAKMNRRRRGEDTVVAVIGDGFRAAQDLRLVKARHGARPAMTDERQKIDYIADDVHAEWLAHRDDIYPGPDGQPDPVRGSLQLVFCNEGVPKTGDWNLYDELRTLLIERGIPRDAIRYIHDAGDTRKKAALFAACNAGHVAVLIGSTERMGVGTNMQRRCIGIHKVHPHWRPDYDAQEDARGRRPGNLNTEIFIKKWITEGSFDTIRAQACERKSVFLRAIKHRDPALRTIEAPADDQVSYAEIAAVGAGEPRLLQKAQLESEVHQLARAQRRHFNNQNALKVAEQQARAAVTAAEQMLADIDTAGPLVIPTAGDAFAMTVGAIPFSARREAGEALTGFLRTARREVPEGECRTVTAGAIGGFTLLADLARDGREHTITLRLDGLPGGLIPLDHRKLPPGIGLVTRLENRLTSLDSLRTENEAILTRQRQEITRTQSAIGAPFPQQDTLDIARRNLDSLIAELRDDPDGTKKTARPAAADGGAPGTPTSAARTGTPHPDTSSHDDPPPHPAPGTQPAGTGTGTSHQPDPPPASPVPAPAPGPDASRTRPPATETAPLQAPAVPEHEPGHEGGALAPPATGPREATMTDGPGHGTTAGLVIEHHRHGTLVHGTQKTDRAAHTILRTHGFRYSSRLRAWYLPRSWTLPTRSQRVSRLTSDLSREDRAFTMRREPPASDSAATDVPRPEPVPAAAPYASADQARQDHRKAISDYGALTRTPAGNHVMSTFPERDARPDALALHAAYRNIPYGWREAFTGTPEEIGSQLAAWAQAARTLSLNLAAENHRAPRFRETLDAFITSATTLASRTQATAQDPDRWARVFAGLPGTTPPANTSRETGTSAQPAPGVPRPDAIAPASDEKTPSRGNDPQPPGTTESPGLPGQAGTGPAHAASAAAVARLAAETAQTDGSPATATGDDHRIASLRNGIRGTRAGTERPGTAIPPAPALPGMQQPATRPDNSLAGHTRPDGTLHPERGRLHDQITEDILAGHQPQQHPVATFFGGGTASGKSSLTADTPDNARIDADAIKRLLPEYQQMLAAGDPRAAEYTHEESSALAKRVEAEAQQRRLNYILDGTGDTSFEKMAAKVARARAAGYGAAGKYVTVDTDTAIQRARRRGARTGRMVPETVLRATHASVSDTFARAADEHLFDTLALLDNNEPGITKVIASHDGTGLLVLDAAAYDRFLAKGEDGGYAREHRSADSTAHASAPGRIRLPASGSPGHTAGPEAVGGDRPGPGRHEGTGPGSRRPLGLQPGLTLQHDHHPAPAGTGQREPAQRTGTEPAQQPGPPAAEPGSTARDGHDPGSIRAGETTTTTTTAAPGPGHLEPAPPATARPPDPPAPAAPPPAPPQPQDPAAGQPGVLPVRNMDLAEALRRSPLLGEWLALPAVAPGAVHRRLTEAGRWPAATRQSADTTPDGPGHPRTVTSAEWDQRGAHITVTGQDTIRHGLVTWEQIADWLGNGITPARLGMVSAAQRLAAYLHAGHGEPAAATFDADAAVTELAQIRDHGLSMIIDAALRSRGANRPVPPAPAGLPAWHTLIPATRPARGAGKAENKALERLTQLRAIIREPQDMTAAEIRSAIRQRAAGTMPDLISALGDPARMRAWISDQTARAGGGHDTAGQRWIAASPQGLVIDRDADDRAPAVISWEEIPAWIEPALTPALISEVVTARDQDRAAFRHYLNTAASPAADTAAAAQKCNTTGELGARAIENAWAAVQAAPSPSPADLEHARSFYRPVQASLFDPPPPDYGPARRAGARDTASAPPGTNQQLRTAARPSAAMPPGRATTPGQPGNPAAQPVPVPGPPTATFGSTARGMAARMAELRAAREDPDGVVRHAWGIAITHPDGYADQCQPTVLDAVLYCSHDRGSCQCVGNTLMYRGVCRGQGCDWEGQPRRHENQATEDAHDHAYPGWRDMPAVSPMPHTTAKALEKPRRHWRNGSGKSPASTRPDGWSAAALSGPCAAAPATGITPCTTPASPATTCPPRPPRCPLSLPQSRSCKSTCPGRRPRLPATARDQGQARTSPRTPGSSKEPACDS
jgi:N12 class adenine-specific DNA methylase/predicted ABC-type ATPase